MSPSHTVMYQISLSPDCKEFHANFFNADITLIEWWFPHAEDCFIDLHAPDHRFEWVTSKYTGGFKPYDIKSCTCFSTDFLNFGCHMQTILHTSTVSNANLQCKENAYTGLDVGVLASKAWNCSFWIKIQLKSKYETVNFQNFVSHFFHPIAPLSTIISLYANYLEIAVNYINLNSRIVKEIFLCLDLFKNSTTVNN